MRRLTRSRLIWISTVCKCISELTHCPKLPDFTLPHLELLHFALALWVASGVRLVPFNSRAPVVTEFIVKNSKKKKNTVYHFSFSLHV